MRLASNSLAFIKRAAMKAAQGAEMSTYYRGEGARSYDQRHQHFTERTLIETLAALDVEALVEHAERQQRVPRLLDVACGTGTLLSLLHERFPGAELYGVDSSQEMLALAQQRLSAVPHLRLEYVVVGPDAQVGLPHPSESFDLITCTNALHAIPEPEVLLTALHRLLAHGGYLLLEDFAWRSPSFSWGIFARLARLVGAESLHPYSLAQARSLCEQAGLSIAHAHAFVIDWLLCGWVISIMKQE
jgi:ubiquinone/menaquinone biosynthesis C-methylase UbiE